MAAFFGLAMDNETRGRLGDVQNIQQLFTTEMMEAQHLGGNEAQTERTRRIVRLCGEIIQIASRLFFSRGDFNARYTALMRVFGEWYYVYEQEHPQPRNRRLINVDMF